MAKKFGVTTMSYDEACRLMRSEGIQTQKQFQAWSRTRRPANFPSHPQIIYRNRGYTTLGAFLGTDRVANRQKTWTFEDARAFARALHLKDRDAWYRYCASDDCPHDLPRYPDRSYVRRGWIGWEDWLGVLQAEKLPFVEARRVVRALKLSGKREWYALVDAGKAPAGIPKYVNTAYKQDGWISWPDFFGKVRLSFPEVRAYARKQGFSKRSQWVAHTSKDGVGRALGMPIRPHIVFANEWTSWQDLLGDTFCPELPFRSFDEARAYARSLNLKTGKEWKALGKTGALPSDIPSNPETVYADEWHGVPDWLGTKTVATYKRQYLSYIEARTFVNQLELQNEEQWRAYSKSEAKPANIPATPSSVYKKSGWINWGDWLGAGSTFRKDFLPWEEARQLARSLGFSCVRDWKAYAASDKRPANLPSNPNIIYAREWRDHGDWLGFSGRWTNRKVVELLKHLLPRIPHLDAIDLFKILHQNGLLRSSRHGREVVERLLGVQHLGDARVMQHAISDLASELAGAKNDDNGDDSCEDAPVSGDDALSVPALSGPTIKVEDILGAGDNLDDLYLGDDEEAARYFVTKGVRKLWQRILSSHNPNSVAEAIASHRGGNVASLTQETFAEQYAGVQTLEIPRGYNFTKRGELCAPNLMQRLVAWRVSEERRVGNWSGTGAGKTLAAILASRTVDARICVVFGVEDTLEQWKNDICNAFPGSRVYIKPRATQMSDLVDSCYVLFNYESLQTDSATATMAALSTTTRVDMVVIDEVHKAKQRNANVSRRRSTLQQFLADCASKVHNLAVLGMSATPVINTLGEGVSLLEMVTGREQPQVCKKPTVGNIAEIHARLAAAGVRYKPAYDAEMVTSVIDVTGDRKILQGVNTKTAHALDVALLPTKVPTIVAQARPGTVIYSHYVAHVMAPVEKALRAVGFSVGRHIGGDKTGLRDFLQGKIDILLASSAIGTGVDGLQERCSRLIIASLPWTGAEYDQLVGRIYRQGMRSKRVDVIIPQVVLEHPEHGTWSWDRARLDHISNKKTLADAALDGVLPGGIPESRHVLQAKAADALRAWITRIEAEG